MKTSQLLITAAVAAALALPALSSAQGGPAPKPKLEAEKCYGIVKAGKNDCQTANSSCAGTSKRDNQGECFGEIALVSDMPRSATVRAVSATNVLAIDREAFQAMFATLPPLRGFVEQLISSRNA